jgi:outer membrane immunogenic protein
MKKKSLLTSVAIFVGAAGSAAAADLPVRMPVKAVAPAPQFSWTGCYGGVHGGGGWGRHVNYFNDISTDANGWLAGGQIGCDLQLGSNWLVGVEAAAAWADIHGATDPFFRGKSVYTFAAETNWIASATARIGLVLERWTIYAKGGAAWAEHQYRVFGDAFIIGDTDRRGRKTTSGWVWGAGIEWAFAPNWSAKLEYASYDFGRHTVSQTDIINIMDVTSPFDSRVQTVTVGFNYRFATGRP